MMRPVISTAFLLNWHCYRNYLPIYDTFETIYQTASLSFALAFLFFLIFSGSTWNAIAFGDVESPNVIAIPRGNLQPVRRFHVGPFVTKATTLVLITLIFVLI